MTTCIPKAQGVPGLATAPNWFDAGAGAPPVRKDIDDPRWAGAYNRGFGDGTGLEAQFRGVYMDPDWRGKKSIFLSWNVVFDASPDNGMDRLYVGFNVGNGASDTLILKVVAYNSSSVDLNAEAPGSVLALSMDPATGNATPLAAPPGWLGQTKAWFRKTPVGWAIHMYVPYDPAAVGLFSDTGIKLPDVFGFFYQIYVMTPTRIGGGAATGGFVSHRWPLSSDVVHNGPIVGGEQLEVMPHPPSLATAWDQFHMSTGAGDPLCSAAGGVTVLSGDLGCMVNGGAPNITIKYSTTSPLPINTIFANVDNQTGAPLPAGAVTARFRIADWGSVIMDPSAPWQDIRGGGAVSNAVSIPVGHPTVTAGSPPPLNFTWQLNAAEVAPYLAGKPSDQCILVELSGGGITFYRDSARQNHLIVPASKVTRRAQISVEGLAPLSGSTGKRDVYLAVQTRNMPAPCSGNQPPGVVWTQEKLAVLQRREVNRKGLEVLGQQGLLAALQSGALDLASVADLQPTYSVRVYHDTGKRLSVNGIAYPVLDAQAGFGMLPDHVGPMYGWEHAMDFPPGVLQEEIAPGFTRIHVPDNGKVHANVMIEAVESLDKPGRKLPWWVWLLLLLILVILIVVLA
jgi:hypothetical protein